MDTVVHSGKWRWMESPKLTKQNHWNHTSIFGFKMLIFQDVTRRVLQFNDCINFSQDEVICGLKLETLNHKQTYVDVQTNPGSSRPLFQDKFLNRNTSSGSNIHGRRTRCQGSTACERQGHGHKPRQPSGCCTPCHWQLHYDDPIWVVAGGRSRAKPKNNADVCHSMRWVPLSPSE